MVCRDEPTRVSHITEGTGILQWEEVSAYMSTHYDGYSLGTKLLLPKKVSVDGNEGLYNEPEFGTKSGFYDRITISTYMSSGNAKECGTNVWIDSRNLFANIPLLRSIRLKVYGKEEYSTAHALQTHLDTVVHIDYNLEKIINNLKCMLRKKGVKTKKEFEKFESDLNYLLSSND